jgi:hypothetical protein
MNVPLKKVSDTLTSLQADPDLIKRVMVKLSEDKPIDTKDDEPKPKKQFGVFILQPNGEPLPEDLTGWIYQINEGEHIGSAFDRVAKAAAIFNTSKKAKKRQVKLSGEAFELIPAKTFKEVGMAVKTKLPVWVVAIPQEVPSVASDT